MSVFGMKVYGQIEMSVDRAEVRRIVLTYFREFTQGRWVSEDGSVNEEVHTSHSFTMDVTKETKAEEKRVIIAIQEVNKAIEALEALRSRK